MEAYGHLAAALKYLVFASVLLLGYVELLPKSGPPLKRGHCWTLLDVTNVLLLLAAGVLSAFGGCVQLREHVLPGLSIPHSLEGAVADVFTALALVLMAVITILRTQRVLGSSGFICVLLGLLVMATMTDLFLLQDMLYSNQEAYLHTLEPTVIVNTLLAAVMVGAFLTEGLRDNAFRKTFKGKKVQGPPDEDDTSLFGQIFCTALLPVLKASATERTNMEAALPRLRRSLRCEDLVNALYSKVEQKSKTLGSPRHFLDAMLGEFWLEAGWVAIGMIAYFATLIVKAPILENLIDASTRSEAIFPTALFVAACLAEFLLSNYAVQQVALLGCRIRSMLQAAIFRKMTQLSSSARSRTSAGYLTSILAVDCLQIASSVFVLPTPLTGILCTPVVVYMLFSRAGVLASLSCAAWIALVLLLPVPLSALQKKLWVRALRARDERLQLMSDLLSSVRLVKMHAWEDVHRDRVERARDTEVALMFRINLLDGLIDSLYSANSSLLMIILFGTLTILDPTRTLTPGVSFTCVYLLFVTDLVNVAASTFLRQRSQGSVGLSRIAKFSNEEEQDEKWMVRENYLNIGTVVLEDCSFAQCKKKDGSATAILEGVRLGVEPGSLVGVVGFVGAGKSTLLAAICGDLHCLSGVVNVRGRVALVSQLPCVHNMTVRDNILYGEQMDEDRYLCVLRACQLMDDLSGFAAGDLTEIGEKGETLSGGQMQRIALARAAYSPRDIYLLDDPLSAVDSKVADRVFHDVLGPEGLLKDKTRILVTNQGSLLRHVDTILVVHDKNVTPFYSLAALSDDPRVPETIRRDLDASSSPKAPSVDSATEKKEVQEEAYDRLMNQEQTGFKTSSLKLTWAVLKLSGLWVPASLLAFAASGVAFTWQLLWMKEWGNAHSAASTVDGSRNVEWVQILVVLCLSDVMLRGIASAMMAASTRRLSLSLHTKMLNAVLFSPVSFFDTTPKGRVLNRFSLDLDAIDGRMCLSGKQCVQNTFHMVARLVVVGLQAPIVLVVGAAGALVLGVALHVAVKISHGSRFLESVRTSRILQHLTETMDCLSTVRAFGVVERFCAHFCHLTDWNLRAYWTFGCCYRFVRLVSSAVVLVVVLVTAVFMVFFAPTDVYGDADDGSMGLALSAVLTIPISMMALSLILFSYLQWVVCFERTLEYTNLEPEVDVFEDENRNSEKPFGRTSLKGELSSVPEVQWRSKGRVTFEDYSASFRPGILPDVLKGITFTIEPLEKVGVVGRTGAGKSSLVLALLRVLRSSGGTIRIDGVDINCIPLRDLRRAITVIPQDPSLIRGSLRDNLDPTGSHTDDEIWEALGRVHLDHLVRGNPKGLQLDTGEAGANLSVGQRQLACLARALVRSPRLLILDEATSKMDGDTDRLIQRTIREIFGTCTLLTIAHRISTLLDYDKILVLGEGRVLEFGPIAELLSRPSSHFRRMAYEAGVLPSAYNLEESCTTHL